MSAIVLELARYWLVAFGVAAFVDVVLTVRHRRNHRARRGPPVVIAALPSARVHTEHRRSRHAR